MSNINEEITAEINAIIEDRNTIRDCLASDGWASIVEDTATLHAIAEAIKEVPTPGKLFVQIKPGSTYTIPRGFHPGTGVVTGVDDYESEGERYKLYDQPDVTPTKQDQVITMPTGDGVEYYGLEPFTVKAIPHPYHDVSGVTATADYVHPNYKYVDKTGVLKSGTMKVVNGDARTTVTLKPSSPQHNVPMGKYYDANAIYYVNVEAESITFTPNEGTQVVKAVTNDKFISQVTVDPIPATYVKGAPILDLLMTV